MPTLNGGIFKFFSKVDKGLEQRASDNISRADNGHVESTPLRRKSNALSQERNTPAVNTPASAPAGGKTRLNLVVSPPATGGSTKSASASRNIPSTPRQPHTTPQSDNFEAETSSLSDLSATPRLDTSALGSKSESGASKSSPFVHSGSTSPPTSAGLNLQSRRTTTNSDELALDSNYGIIDSDSELEDMSAILARFRKDKQPARVTPRKSSTPQPLAPVFRRNDASPYSTALREQRKLKFSLAELVKSSNKDHKDEARLFEEKAEAERETSDVGSNAEPEIVIRKALEAAASNAGVQDSDEVRADVERVMAAMRNTNALEVNMAWHMFPNKMERHKVPSFPDVASSALPCWHLLEDLVDRESAFLSGFVMRVARQHKLPDAIFQWLLSAVCNETLELLASSYMATLVVALAHNEYQISLPKVREMFRSLGCTIPALDTTIAITPERQRTDTSKRHLAPNIGRILEVVVLISTHLDSEECRLEAMKMLARLSLDYDMHLRADYMIHLNRAMLAMVENIPETNLASTFIHFLQSMFDTIQPVTFRYKLLRHFPSTTDRTSTLRRRMGLCFLLDSPKHASANLANPAYMARVVVHLRQHDIYNARTRPDLGTLNAYIGLVGISLDTGFSNFSFLNHTPTPSVSTSTNPLGSLEDEKEFNNSIDILTSLLREISARIHVTSASNIRGAETKARIERMAQKIESMARSKPRARRDFFGVSDGGAAGLMRRWVAGGADQEGEERRKRSKVDGDE